jgi:hypothetical protein
MMPIEVRSTGNLSVINKSIATTKIRVTSQMAIVFLRVRAPKQLDSGAGKKLGANYLVRQENTPWPERLPDP